MILPLQKKKNSAIYVLDVTLSVIFQYKERLLAYYIEMQLGLEPPVNSFCVGKKVIMSYYIML